MIKGILFKHNNKERVPNKPNITYFKIPYVCNLSERLAAVLNSETIKVAFNNKNTIGKTCFTKQKTKTPKDVESAIVYRIPCEDCQKCYVGQTGRYLKQRISEHQRDSKKLNVVNPTALVEHTREYGHKFNFKEAEIISKQRNLSKRLFDEMIQIKRFDTVNTRKDIEGLSSSYFGLISKVSWSQNKKRERGEQTKILIMEIMVRGWSTVLFLITMAQWL